MVLLVQYLELSYLKFHHQYLVVTKQCPEYKFAFINLIHNNSDISNVENFFRPKLCLRSKSSRLIKNFVKTNGNCESACTEILDNYDNKLLIAEHH